ncbi:M20/M25/M40 family metallo-hydrolase [Sphingomonas silueang]|uniref:M20/M25/M40 family metallo-hydrolase n=1 Tax=Sphingomonas silueang TaxID=3156617 RepID=UPI0032B3862A
MDGTLPLRPILLATCLIAAPLAAQSVDRDAVNRIIDEGTTRTQVMPIAEHLTDRIGGRLPNSPQMREAERWTQAKFREWGLTTTAEGFEFGRGWTIERSNVRMVSPRAITLTAIPIAWTPGTGGPVTAPVIVAPIADEKDFADWRGKLRGKVVMVSRPGTGSEPTEPAFRRLTAEDLAKADSWREPEYDPADTDRRARRLDFARKLDAFLKSEAAVAMATMSSRDGKLLHGSGYLFTRAVAPAVPAIEIAAEDYRRLARLAVSGPAPTLEIDTAVRFDDSDPTAYNILADLPGTDPKAGYVMAGAHFDSWVAGDGAVDNAAGTAVVMEAARILSALKVRPKRTIRFALWNAEEQGLLGSLAYVEKHIATRPEPAAGRDGGLARFYGWTNRFPITKQPGYDAMTAYFNIDNGSGRIRGINAENNVAAVPTLREWLSPFASMGATTVANRRTGSTDHYFFQSVGLQGYQFIQDPLDYGSRLHHTSIDTFDHIKGPDMRQNAIILASLLLSAANADKALPRPPLPTQPVPTDPYAIPEKD